MKTKKNLAARVVLLATLTACDSTTSGRVDAEVSRNSSSESAPEECRVECEAGDPCADIPFDEFPSLSTTRTEWKALCDAAFFVIEGTCDDGSSVLSRGTGYTSEIRFYDKDGKFRGLIETTDVCAVPCNCETYWPEVVRCEHSTTTEVFCGKAFSVGDPIHESRWGN